MSDFLAMHGYAQYIWICYGVFVVVLLADALAPVFQRRRTLAELRGRLKRDAAKGARSGSPP